MQNKLQNKRRCYLVHHTTSLFMGYVNLTQDDQRIFLTDQNFKKERIEISKLSLFIAILRLSENVEFSYK